jgi:hypothetical protein
MTGFVYVNGEGPKGNGRHSITGPAVEQRAGNGQPSARARATRGGYLGRGLPARQRADLAAQAYAQKRPLERPSLATYAAAYRVSVAQVQRRLRGKPQLAPTPTLAEHIVRSTPAELAAAAKALGVDAVWDSMILPIIGAREVVTR